MRVRLSRSASGAPSLGNHAGGLFRARQTGRSGKAQDHHARGHSNIGRSLGVAITTKQDLPIARRLGGCEALGERPCTISPVSRAGRHIIAAYDLSRRDFSANIEQVFEDDQRVGAVMQLAGDLGGGVFGVCADGFFKHVEQAPAIGKAKHIAYSFPGDGFTINGLNKRLIKD